jgi:prepilin-type N-terminal cleavage/methylation domain-containing protein
MAWYLLFRKYSISGSEKKKMNFHGGGVRVKSFKRAKGFSLIEVLIALFILSIALLALAGLMVATTRNNSFGSNMTEAATFAQDKVEELKVSSWGTVASGVDARIGSTGINYARTWTVTDNPNGTQRWVNITVNWNDLASHSISFLSVIAP